MNTTLSGSEPPFSPEKSTLSQLPFFTEDRVDDLPLPPTPPSVCKACWEGIFAMHFGLPCLSAQDGQLYQNWPKEFSYSTSFPRLVSRSGCAWCQFVLREAYHASRYAANRRLTITVRGTWEKWDEYSDDNFCYQHLSVEINDTHSFEGFVYAALDDPAEPYVSLRSPIPDVGSPTSLDLARWLIDRCLHEHEYCKGLMSLDNALRLPPKRLIDCTDLTRPRLVSLTNQHAEYVALSYVWGDLEQTYQATTSNEAIYKDKIDPDTLPATIRDTIRVTHMLGFRWLWIDSLCILQDSDEDKSHEIGRMHNIYRYAHLTIIAASAERVTEGFLHKRPPPDNDVALPFICPPHPLSSPTGYQSDRSVMQSQVGQVYLAEMDLADQSYSEMFARMATRAWCMQEYLMSPRCLIFTSRALLFKCRDITSAVGNATLHYWDDLHLPGILFEVAARSIAEFSYEDRTKMHMSWLNIVNNYSRRTASVESDKLVACAAVAEQYHRVMRSDYVASLWHSEMLPFGLLWSVDTMAAKSLKCRHTHPTAYRAPSWSWAAIEGPLCTYPSSTANLGSSLASQVPLKTFVLAEVVDCKVTLEDAALPFGRVTDGILTLRGVPIPCRGDWLARRGFADQSWFVRLPSLEQARRRQWGLGHLNDDEKELDGLDWIEPADRAIFSLDRDVDELPERMWTIPLVCNKWDGEDTVEGIVLELASQSCSSESRPEKPRFRRIGHLIVFVNTVAGKANFTQFPLWAPLTRAVEDGERPSMDIEIV